MTHKETRSVFERFQILLEDEMGSGKLITYGIASAGLLVALYRIRPFAKFKKPSDVPFRFIQSHVPLQGAVARVEPGDGALLMVDHQPLLPLSLFNSKNYLPIKIAGIDVTGNGLSWLQSVISGKYVTFVPIVKEKDYLECIVMMPQEETESLNIGKELVKLGFGTIHEPCLRLKNKHIQSYKRSLVSAQKWAIYRRNGHWHFVSQPTVLWKTQMFILNKIKSSLPAYIVKWLGL